MPHDSQERLIALAGIYQAVNSVMRIARQGTIDTSVMEPSLHSLLQIDAENVSVVFGPPCAVANGARQIIAQLTGQPARNFEMTQYVMLLMKLERNLSGHPHLLRQIGLGIEQARDKHEHFALLHPNLITHFADLYSATISTLQPRIMVSGDPLHLQSPDNQNRIRALLLAGIRAAMLWRQIGGTRWQILFGGKQILADARRYLDGCAAA